MTIHLTAMTHRQRIDVVDGHEQEYKNSNMNYHIASSLRHGSWFVLIDDLQLKIKHTLVRNQNHSLPGTLGWSDGVRKMPEVKSAKLSR
jgi:hypothetical protein